MGIVVKSGSWIVRLPDLYEKTLQQMQSCYPKLDISIEDNRLVFRGLFVVSDIYSEVEPFEPFQLEITLPDRFPDDFPYVRETAGRIPQTIDRHVYGDGSACLGTPVDHWRRYPNGCNLIQFLQNEVYDWCVYQLCIENDIDYIHGDRAHGLEGIYQSIAELLAVDTLAIPDFLELLSRRNFGGHSICPCRSRKLLRYCHAQQVHEARKIITPSRAKWLMERLWPKPRIVPTSRMVHPQR